MKKPFLHALTAALYIISLILVIQTGTAIFPQQEATIIVPITMLSLFVLSAAVMGFLFLSEPLQLLLENRKSEAVAFFSKVVGFFACFLIVFVILLLLNVTPVLR